MADLTKLVDDLSALTVIEAAELAKMLEEKWGVSAAAPVAAAAAGGGAPAAEVVAEKTEFDVILATIGEKKVNVIKEALTLNPLAFFLLLPAKREAVTGHGHLDVFRIEAGDLRSDRELLVAFDEFDFRRPSAGAVGEAPVAHAARAEETVEQMVHLVPQPSGDGTSRLARSAAPAV